MKEIDLKFDWVQVPISAPVYFVRSLIDPRNDKPLLKISYNAYNNKRDPWTIEITGIRKVTRDECITHVDQVKKMAESMLLSLVRGVDEVYYGGEKGED